MKECIAIFNDELGKLEYKQELIRCEDCVWWDKWHNFSTMGDCPEIGLSTEGNGYCSMAIRKDAE